ncbi:hypothetical protein M406DRAFT_339052 [Cryphonectria parasitica EP155]|uniref:Laccase n=1 Tax=Cryphonectria parasitica (strain ATCC 38755 / EP155) TaxID=660469 RepID=A0A9P4Y290_CRYP1|nr:uncharacterized protein M406DRAFT_339052 [Cryphonectria parasitica EP155]KAF3765652.1 hypothetical protein M406DRAFT_339052 [Cryphonectria parasitica EP155]
MGFFQSCIDALLQLAALTPFTPYDDYSQKPLFGSSHDACVYPARWTSCNTPTSRDCWLQDTESADEFGAYSQIDIHTDYENEEATPRGITREYWLEVDGDFLLTADGFPKTSGKVFNKQYPGPLIEACWGDELVIHVKNNYTANGTAIHWHGIRQLNTMQMDGVNGVTQCPIAYEDSFTYKFRALQYGHTWYHSHYSLQYPDGLAGPLVIHGPSSTNWDIDLGPILIQDYVHDSAFVRYQAEITPGSIAYADSIVVNGTGHDPATGTGAYFNTTFTKGKKHVLRLINGSSGTHYIFSIDGHNFTVIETDLVPIEPYTTTSLSIGIGQRYMIVVEADQEPGDYWMRTHPATGCNTFTPTLPCGGRFSATCEPFNVTTGIIRYDASSTAEPTSQPWPYSTLCLDEPYSSLKPVVPWVIDHHPANEITDNRFAAVHQTVNSSAATGGYAHWELTPDFLWLDFGNPTILNFDNKSYDQDSNFHIVDVTHPLHWHGMDVVVLAQNTTTFDPVSSYETFNFVNPPRRDVVLLPAGGYIAIAFKPDNPGAWLLHCHIAWHASAGLGLQILERQHDIVRSLGGPEALAETERVCQNWRQYNSAHPVDQDDSGI